MDTEPLVEKRCALRDHLINEIRAGRCPPGTSLPSEGDLSVRFGVSRTTVRSAMDMLDRSGLIVRRKGRVTQVHPEAERRLDGDVGASAVVSVVLTAERLNNSVFTSILDAFHEHLPRRIQPRVYFHNFVKPGLYADTAAVLLDGGFDAEALAAVRERVPRVIVINRSVRNLPSVCTDNRAGGELMAAHALERGHRRIGVLHYGDSQTELEFIQRLKGIRTACARAGVKPLEVAMQLHRLSAFTPHQAVDRLLRLDPNITVILCLTDAMAMQVLEILTDQGVQVPGRMALVGFDDMPNSRYSSPPLTTVRQPVEEMGLALARGIAAVLEGRPAGLGRPIRPQLVLRDSCPTPRKGRLVLPQP